MIALLYNVDLHFILFSLLFFLRKIINEVKGRKEKVPICAAELQICSAIWSGKDDPNWGRWRELCRFSSRHHSSILLLVILNTERAFCANGPIADSPDNIRASAYCRTASETSATFLHEISLSSRRKEKIDQHVHCAPEYTLLKSKKSMYSYLKLVVQL